MIIVPEQPHTKERDRAGSLTMPHGPAECGTARRILPGHNARPRQPNPRLSGEAGGVPAKAEDWAVLKSKAIVLGTA